MGESMKSSWLFVLALFATVAAMLVSACGEPPPVVGARYQVLSTRTEQPRSWSTPNYSCIRWDEEGWCVMEALTGYTHHYDDPDYIVKIRQCWPKGDKKNPDAQKCIKRDLYVIRENFEKAIDQTTYVVTDMDSINDGDVDT